MEKERQCRKCLELLSIGAFYKQKSGNYRWVCRPCCRRQQFNEHGKGTFKGIIHNFVYGVKA